MSQQIRTITQRPKHSTAPRRHHVNAFRYDPESSDPRDEAQFLLSRFTRNSSSVSQDTSREGCTIMPSDYATNDFIVAVSTGRERSTTTSGSMSGQHSNNKLSLAAPILVSSSNRPSSSKTNDGENGRNLGDSRDRSLPTGNIAYSRDRSDSNSHSPGPSDAKGLTTSNAQRPRRSAGPVNYYAPIKLSIDGSHDKEETTDATKNSSNSAQIEVGRSNFLSPSTGITQNLIICANSEMQIVRQRIESLDEFPQLARARYTFGRSPAHYAKKFRKDPETPILHVDFTQCELVALLNVFSFLGLEWRLSNDMALMDQVIQLLNTVTKGPQALGNLASQVSDLCKLSRLLSESGIGLDSLLEKKVKPKTTSYPQTNAYMISLFDKILSASRKRSQTPDMLSQLSSCLNHALKLKHRRTADVKAFLWDAMNGCLSSTSFLVRAAFTEDLPVATRARAMPSSFNRNLQRREFGQCSIPQFQKSGSRGLKLCKSWRGASNDVIVLTWSPDCTRFAIGAAAQSDEHNMQYNRNNNLVLGDLTRNVLKELPDHHVPRPAQSYSNVTTCDTRLFMTVTALEWHEDNNILYSASFDKTVKLWDVSSSDSIRCFQTLRHDAKVEVMARSTSNSSILATGTDKFVLWNLVDAPTYVTLDVLHRRNDLTPTSLEWGQNPASRHVLVGGMSAGNQEYDVPQEGHLAVWLAAESDMVPLKMIPNSQNIFDIKWHPHLPTFITGSSARPRTSGLSRQTKSAVRAYEPLTHRQIAVEFECPALDINDVTFCPTNSNYVTASCTDGATYVWDFRKPSRILHKFQHGSPLNQIDENLTREQADVGVRATLWGDNVCQLFTGASDGVLRLWDILRSPEDALIDNVAFFKEEIMSASFSSDKTNLLIGDSAGGVHILSAAPFWNTDDDQMKFEFADGRSGIGQKCGPPSGIEIATEFLSSGQLVRHPTFGVGQGPNYRGPFARWARPKDTPSDQLAVTPLAVRYQQRQLDGSPVQYRPLLDLRTRNEIRGHIRLARIRNSQRHIRKRKRELSANKHLVNLLSDEEEAPPTSSRYGQYVISSPGKVEIVDLTISDSEEDVSLSSARKEEPAYEETLEEKLEPDFWWPASEDIDANIREENI